MLERLFKLSDHRTTVRGEVIAGLTTFAAMAYILAVNPNILAAAGMPKEALITVTALAAAVGCLLIALATNYPIALAPGMGTNAYFAFVIVLGMGVPWQSALALTFWNGVIFLLLSVTGLRSKIADSLPSGVKIGIQAGIGFFIAFIGLQNVNIVVGDDATLVSVGDLASPSSALVLFGIVLIAVLTVRKFPAAILVTILGITAVGMFLPAEGGGTITQRPSALFGLPAGIGEVFGQLDLWYPFTHFNAQTFTVLLTLLMLDLFDSLGTLIGLARRAGLIDENGKMPLMGRALAADAVATSAGAVLGTSTTTSYVESAAGVEAGGRTGLTSVVVAGCFLLSLFLAPIITAVPAVATTPALVMVGIFMAQGLRDLKFDDLPETAAAVLTMLMIPLTFSITEGIGLGMVVWALVMALTGRLKEVPWLTWLVTALFVLYFVTK
ncbi:MAG: NCS2 family permease [Opitutales bacterium]